MHGPAAMLESVVATVLWVSSRDFSCLAGICLRYMTNAGGRKVTGNVMFFEPCRVPACGAAAKAAGALGWVIRVRAQDGCGRRLRSFDDSGLGGIAQGGGKRPRSRLVQR